MKKIFVLMLALCLAVPAISYAGSATSRWDLTIGGVVRTDIGWVDSKATMDMATSGAPARDDRSGSRTADNKYGNWFWGGGQTGLNFTVRGPDAFGAKTWAFISGDFVGIWGGSSYGTFDLVVANMNMDWKNTSLTIGMGGGTFGMLPTFASGNQLGWSTFGFGGKGPAPVNAMVKLTQRFGKNFAASFEVSNQSDANANNGLTSISSALRPTGTNGTPPGPTSYQRSDYPLFMGGLTYSSAACGKVGPWQLTLATGGAWGQEKRIFGSGDTLDDKTVDMWIADFRWLVPIIPEKNGNKAGALYTDGAIFSGQNMDGYYGGWAANGALSYQRPFTGTPSSFASPVSTGGVAHAAFYLTDQLYVNGFYWYTKLNSSTAFKAAFPDSAKNVSQYIATVVYDLNPAMKFVVDYTHTEKKYAGPSTTAGLKNTGTQNAYRVGAFYFF